MLKGLLDNKTCAACKICCGFDNTDLWELPVMNADTAGRLKESKPDVKLLKCGNGFVADAGALSDEQLFYCPALDSSTGCTLGEHKPFDCLIWPFRVMETEDKKYRMITLSPVCPELIDRPLSQLSRFVQGEFEKIVFSYAQENPEVVKPYINGYPILAFRRIL